MKTFHKELLSLLLALLLNIINFSFGSDPPESTSAAETPVQLIGLAMREEYIYGLVEDRIKNLREELKLLEKYSEDYKDSSLKITGRLENSVLWDRAYLIAAHPLLSYRMLNRYSKNFSEIKKFLMTPRDTDVLKTALQMEGYVKPNLTVPWPNYQDTVQALDSILKIHHIYDINVQQFISGNILGLETGVQLNADYATKIGLYALEANYYDLAIEWLQEANRKVLEDNDLSIPLDVTTQLLKLALKTHDEAWNKLPQYYPHLFETRTNMMEKGTVSLKRRNSLLRNLHRERLPNHNLINFWGLCSGSILQANNNAELLYCYLDTNSNLAFTINPLKVEVLSRDPGIYQFYDVIGDNTISEILKRAEPNLERSRVINDQLNTISSVRTSSQTFLKDSEIPELQWISKKINLITGLDDSNLEDWENLQVVSYTFGRFYTPHLDSPSENLELKGDQKLTQRIATFLLYLNDVQMGGNTAFPAAGVVARPVKGSAVFWHNLHLNGFSNSKTWHGSCPVVLGVKWAANKWIGYTSQFRSRPCTLNPYQ